MNVTIDGVGSFRLSKTLCALILAALGGCGTTPDRDVNDAGAPIPAAWTATTSPQEAVTEHWVESFADATLNALVSEALASNYDLKAAAARVEAARQQARIDGAGRWPQLYFSPGYERAQVRSAGFGSTEFGAFEALFSLDWELDVWGRIRAFQQASVSEAVVTEADFHAARLSLAARAAQGYFELAEAKLQAEVAEQSIRDRRTIVELVRGRFTRGLDLRLALTDGIRTALKAHWAECRFLRSRIFRLILQPHLLI
ncbi:TolC family protein [Methylocaldum szegediense]|jgi:outer membrane protein TolC|uniref:TolC family protein n=1 Tax=Methylocaldum szegediense TaxID=73780 RepID=UPI000421EE7E|nr:TolC family protein [Methylocaldum szegediense]